MSQYISKKSDAKSKPPTQSLVKDKWLTVEAGGITKLVPTENSEVGALWVCYLNITTPKLAGATELTLKWVRDAAGINDATGYTTVALKKRRYYFHYKCMGVPSQKRAARKSAS